MSLAHNGSPAAPPLNHTPITNGGEEPVTSPPPIPIGVYHRREVTSRAERVTAANLADLAKWCQGSTWGASVIVPVSINGHRTGEDCAPVGSWLVQIGHRFEIWADDDFTREWVPVVPKTVYQPISETR